MTLEILWQDPFLAWKALMLAMARFSGFALLLPFFRAPTVPPMARNGIIAALGLTLLPEALEALPQIPQGLGFFLFLMKELLTGLAMGFTINLLFLVPQSVGDFIDNQRGASIASLFNPAAGDQSSDLGLLLGQMFLAAFLVIEGLPALLGLLYASFQFYPLAAAMPLLTLSAVEGLLLSFGIFLSLMLLAAGPAALAMLLTEMAMGLTNRVAPQLNVFFLSMPLKSVVALAVLSLYLGLLLEILLDHRLFWDQALHFFTPAEELPEEIP